MNTDTNKPKDTNDDSQEVSVDEIMQSIMATIAESNPSPLDEEHQAVVQEARPLEYDMYRYDDKPAVILGAGMSATSGMGTQKHYPDVDYHAPSTEEIEPMVSEQEAPSVDFDPNPTGELPKQYALMPQAQQIQKEREVEKTSSFEIPRNYDPSNTYHAQFDFGFKNPPKIISVVPFVLHILISLATAALIINTFAFKNQAQSPFSFNAEYFTYTLYGLGIIVGWGLIFGLLAGIISFGISKESSWFKKILLRSGITTLIGVLLWGIAMGVSEALAQGIIAF